MVLKVFFLLATLALVSLPTCNATVQQQQQQQAQQQCVSQADFDSVVTQIAAVESELNTWQKATIYILKRFLLENPALLLETVQDKLGSVQDKLASVQDKLENIQYKMEQQQDKTNRLLDEHATFRNTTMDALTDLQHQIEQQQNKTDREMAALENTIMDGKNTTTQMN